MATPRPAVHVVATGGGSRDELKPGAHIAISRAQKKPDGTYEADRASMAVVMASCPKSA
jgi:hypothetical protein